MPVAARSTYTYAYDRVGQAKAGFQDEARFAKEVQVDAFRNTPADRMLTALRGKDVDEVTPGGLLRAYRNSNKSVYQGNGPVEVA